MILLTLLYVVDRMTDKLADVNNQSSVGMFSYHASLLQYTIVNIS